MRDETISKPFFAGVLLCFLLSGAAGLIYQVAWGKALGLVFGNTVYAIATILAVFMGGLALGSALLGRWCERWRNAVALYGWMEILIAAAGALSLVGLAGVRQVYLAAYHHVSDFPPALVGLRFAGAAVVLLLPTFLMGGTLPVLVRGLTRSSAELGARVSRLYWVNTLGAVLGTFAAGFLLLPAFGLKLTVATAVALNVLAGVIALGLGRSAAAVVPAEDAPAPSSGAPAGDGAVVAQSSAAPAEGATKAPLYLLAGFAVVGGSAIAYEICWTRMLATILGSSTYAFTLMLGTFLTGIVLGSILFEVLDRRWTAQGREIRLALFATTQTLIALAAILFLMYYRELPSVVPVLLQMTKQNFAGMVLTQFATSALAMLPAAIVFGFNFPVVTVLIAGRDTSGRHYGAAVGRAYAANTLGAIIGATAAGFWLVPLVGSFRLVALVAAANLFLAAFLCIREKPARGPMAAVNLLLFAGVLTISTTGAFYDRSVANFGTSLYWARYSDSYLTVPEMAETTDVIYAADGLNATISVARTENYLAIRTNGKVDASNNDRITQLLVGHLPAIFHPSPRKVLIVGFGSGMTVSAVALHPQVERIDCVEIEPGVIRAAQYLEKLHRGVTRDPRLHIIIDDARNFLLTTQEKYDVIISEPSNPWIAGVAALFTDEFYREAKSRLNPGGIFVQWVQAYSMYPQDFKMILATFVPHFPQVSLWRGEPPDYLMIAQRDADPLTLDRLRKLWTNLKLREDFESLGLDRPEGILAFHRLDDGDLRALARGGEINTDDRTQLEYRAPRGLLAKNLADANRDLIWTHRNANMSSLVQVEDAVTAQIAAAHALVRLDDDDAEYFLLQLEKAPSSRDLELVRGNWHLQQGRLAEARAAFQRALALDAGSLEAAWGIGESYRKLADTNTAELMYRQVLNRDANYVPALRAMSDVYRSRGKWQESAEWQARVIKAMRNPGAKEYTRLGEMLAEAGQLELAERTFRAALEFDPYAYAAHRNLGELNYRRKQFDVARAHLEFVIRFFPDTDPTAYIALADIYRSAGRIGDAVAIIRKGNRIFPSNTELKKLLPAGN